MKRPIIIILGEPNSISSEIFLKSLNYIKKTKLNFIIIGNYSLLEKQANYLDFKINVKFKLSEINSLENVKFNFINVDYKQSKPFNLKTNNSDTFVKKCFEHAVILLKKKLAIGLINLPINKSKFTKNKYKGITEYIADKTNNRNKENMLLFNENFSVCPGTTHIRINNVSNLLNSKTIYKNINNIYNFYRNIIGIKNPKIAILGLNPHSGVDFKGNTEERKIIIPLLKKIKRKFNLSGPISPDSSFANIKTNKVDCILGHYHDQVLTTFKYINGLNAINITLGLPFLRISPDHGTAKDIVGQNKASPKSFLYALEFFEKYHKVI